MTTTTPKRTQWTRADWLAIITQIHLKHPELNLSTTSNKRGLKPNMFEDAMHQVLEPWKHRKSFQVTSMGINLDTALQDLRDIADLMREAEEEKERQRLIDEEIRIARELEEKGPSTETNPYEAAFSPLIQLIANEVTKQLEPRLNRIENMLLDLLKSGPTADSLRSKYSVKNHEDAIVERRNIKVRKTRIAVVGVLPIQAQAIESSFSHLEFTFIEKGPTGILEKVQACDRVIGLTKFMGHPTDGVLRKGLGKKYTRVSGGPSDVKRVIELWINSGLIPKPEAQAA